MSCERGCECFKVVELIWVVLLVAAVWKHCADLLWMCLHINPLDDWPGVITAYIFHPHPPSCIFVCRQQDIEEMTQDRHPSLSGYFPLFALGVTIMM